MLAVNHMLVGATIGLVVANPLIGAVSAVGSHFVLDALPQFGYDSKAEQKRYGSLYFKSVLATDIALIVLLLGGLFYFQRYDLIVFALLAYSPDILWIYKFIFVEQYGKKISQKRLNFFTKFHANIQIFEYPWMFPVEIVISAGLAYFIFSQLI